MFFHSEKGEKYEHTNTVVQNKAHCCITQDVSFEADV